MILFYELSHLPTKNNKTQRRSNPSTCYNFLQFSEFHWVSFCWDISSGLTLISKRHIVEPVLDKPESLCAECLQAALSKTCSPHILQEENDMERERVCCCRLGHYSWYRLHSFGVHYPLWSIWLGVAGK